MAIDTPDNGGGINIGSLLGNAIDKTLGQQVTDNQNGSQTTKAGSNSSSSGSTLGTQQVSQAGTTQNFGAGTTLGSTAQSSDTAQTQRTTGTTGTAGSSNTSFNQMQKTDADTSALRDVYAKQMAGISPDMLAAIFRDGSKQAPQLLAAQSAALGARAQGNTPVAQSLNMLNRDLVDSSARINMQMLQQAGLTANQIADLTKSVSTSGSSSTSSQQSTIQDLLTAINGHTDTIGQNFGATTSSNVGTSLNNSNAVNTSDTANNSKTDQTQQTNSTLSDTKKTSINSSALGKLGGMAAAGVGLNALFKAATGQGFIGTLKDFAKQLAGSGQNLPQGTMDEITKTLQGGDIDPEILGGGLPGEVYSPGGSGGLDDITNEVNQPLPSLMPVVPEPDVSIPNGEFDPSGLFDFGFADGGQPDVPNLLQVSPMLHANNGDDGALASAAASLFQDPAATAANQQVQQLTATQQQLKKMTPGAKVNETSDALTSMAIKGGLNMLLPGAGTIAGMIPGFNDVVEGVGSVVSDIGDAIGGIFGWADGGMMDGAEHTDFQDSESGPGEPDDEIAELENHIMPHDKGGVTLSRPTANLVSSLLKGQAGMGSYANGGQIKGPGTGVSDSIPAQSASGPIKVANGEYIVPADVVNKLGVGYFDSLLDKFHTPAAVQRAAGV
jgi:hypothetical protein